MSPGDLKEYYQHLLTPENMVLTVVGDVDGKGQSFGGSPKGIRGSQEGVLLASGLSAGAPSEKKRRTEIFKTKEQAHFVLGFWDSFHHKTAMRWRF